MFPVLIAMMYFDLLNDETLWSNSFDVSSSAGVQFPVLWLKKRKAFFSFYRSFQKELVFFIPALLTKMFDSLSIILINIHIPAVKPAATIMIVLSEGNLWYLQTEILQQLLPPHQWEELQQMVETSQTEKEVRQVSC